MSSVSVIHGSDRRENVRKAVGLVIGGSLDKLRAAQSILVKPNLVHHQNQLASTHVDAVRGVLDVIREYTQAPITVGDASYHGTKPAFRNFGYENLLVEYNLLDLYDLNDDATVPGFYVKRDGARGEMRISKKASESDFTISLANMKIHRDTGVTLTIKNWSLGIWVVEPQIGVDGKYWPRWPFLHTQGNKAHHETITEILGRIRANVSVIDAFTAMEGDGPTRGTPVEMNLALASLDPVSVDSIATRLMSMEPQSIDHLRLAHERGYGTMEEIQILGEQDWRRFKKTFKR